MALDASNFDYPLRRYGMDHDRYDWSLFQRRPRVAWPEGKAVALWVTVPVEIFPLDDDGKPFKLPGAVRKPYPDVQTYTWRDYGNRVGIYRLMRAFDRFGIRPCWAVNGAVAEDIPGLIADIGSRGEEVIAHGWDMATPQYGGMDEGHERAIIARTLDALRSAVTTPVTGWMSPGKSESAVTPDLIAEAGLDYLCDWPNDELPYDFRTRHGPILAMPHSTDLDDRQIIVDYKHHEADFVEQVKDHYRFLSREAAQDGGRVMSLTLHPWVTGQSHRIAAVEDVLGFLAEQPDVWSASASDIAAAWRGANVQPG